MKILIIIIFSTLLTQLSSSLLAKSLQYFNGFSEAKKSIILKQKGIK